MTQEDLAWVQGQLRGCANARRQLRICAECLCGNGYDAAGNV